MKQVNFLEKKSFAYGGALLKKRKARLHARPLTTKATMHLVLRSSQARGEYSLLQKEHKLIIDNVFRKFSKIHAVKILKLVNVSNHLHLEVKLGRRASWRPFIGAVTGAIALKIGKGKLKRFWDRRPFTRILRSFRERIILRKYFELNELEALGMNRLNARFFLASKSQRQI